MAYELMQKYYVDASQRYYSLDDIYYFGGQQAHDVVAIEDNINPPGGNKELSFHIGDSLGIAGNEKDGFSVGTHRKTAVRGSYPSYKVEEHVLIADFPSYNEVS